MTERAPASPVLKLAVDLGPLIAFFAAYSLAGLMVATGVLMAATVAAVALAYALERRVATMPLVSAGLALGFGALTLVLADEVFIKMKPTAVYMLFAGVLLVGQALGRPLLKPLFEAAFQVDEAGWRILTLRWGAFFVAMAGLNEFVWRTMATETWVNVKVFGFLPLTFVFAIAQAPLIKRHEVEPKAPPPS